MPTTIEVVVDELCTNTVAKTPIVTPATGFFNISFCWKTFPAVFPEKNHTKF
jgi:hypothetical protein